MSDNSVPQLAERQRRGLPVLVTLLILALIAGIITGIVSSRSGEAPPELKWTPIDGGLEETILKAPVDHDVPGGETLDLRILRRPADDPAQRIGSLLVNPGGPGFGAEALILNATEVFQTELLSRFDIVGMDPRGTGKSSPAIDCIDDYDALWAASDLTPSDDATRATQIAVATSYAESCIQRTGDSIAHMTTAATARDLDLLRRALGEDKISYFGTSYGCELGATWATLFPDTVRAAVLDGCADPTADPLESARQQAAGFQASVEAFLNMCVAVGPECPIPHDGDPGDALRALWTLAATDGIASMPGRPAVNESVLQTATIMSMYSEEIWPAFAMGVAMGLDSDGSLLMQLADAYTQRQEDGTWGNELEAFSVIRCMDALSRPSLEQQAALMTELEMIAPFIYPAGSFSVSICTSLPAAASDPVTITGAGAPPVLVLGNTGDPATPFASTESMVASLASAVLVTIESNNHGGYGTNECVNETVHRYLIDLTVPEVGTRC
jgi:pimeloyl-ACP methyl ester carboxylesterase